jgi:hypothetical protein
MGTDKAQYIGVYFPNEASPTAELIALPSVSFDQSGCQNPGTLSYEQADRRYVISGGLSNHSPHHNRAAFYRA